MTFLGNITLVQQAGWLGGYEIIIIVVIILLMFGGKKIPELMRGMGKGIKEFKEGIDDNSDKKDDLNKNKEDDKDGKK